MPNAIPTPPCRYCGHIFDRKITTTCPKCGRLNG